MYFDPAPNLTSASCLTLAFVSSINLMACRKRKLDQIAQARNIVEKLIETVNEDVLGKSYMSLTGVRLPSSGTVGLADGALELSAAVSILCPRDSAFLRFKSHVLRKWTALPLYGGDLYVLSNGSPITKMYSPRNVHDEPRPRGWWQRTFGEGNV